MFELLDVARIDDNPADLAALRVDYPEFVATLTDRQQRLLAAFLAGHTTSQIARRLGVTGGYISQVRRRIVELWHAFTA